MLNDNLNVLQADGHSEKRIESQTVVDSQIFGTYECEHELQSLSLGFKAIQAYAYYEAYVEVSSIK